MTANIERISLWEDNPKQNNNVRIVRIDFKFPCTYTCLNIEDLKTILRQWIIGEERAYPPSEGFKGRRLLLEEISKVFSEEVKL